MLLLLWLNTIGSTVATPLNSILLNHTGSEDGMTKTTIGNTTTMFTKKKKIEENSTCGYDYCTDARSDVLNVHIVLYSHSDAGRLKTADQYYYESVQHILVSVVKELWGHPDRRFVFASSSYLWKWWSLHSDSVRARAQRLARRGQLRLAGGAWAMSDEAAAHYQGVIDQFTLGLSKLNQTIGPCAMPRVGWQVDSYGHSREFASLLAQMGYHGLFLGRVDYQDKAARVKDMSLQMVWRGDDDLGNSTDIFTEVLYNRYDPPPDFCFDVSCHSTPITDDNVEEKMKLFLDYVSQQAKSVSTQHVLVTLGGALMFRDAAVWFRSLDKLIQYTNLWSPIRGLGVKLFYSTPECYLKAVHGANPKLSIKQDDFFPYASDPVTYWTGYYTSRPTLKYFEKVGNTYLQTAKQLLVLSGLHLKGNNQKMNVLNQLKNAMGVLQHYDAVAGTAQQHVVNDYVKTLHRAIEDSLLIARDTFNAFMQGPAAEAPMLSFHRCRLNESSCHVSETSQEFIVTVYNPLAWRVNESIRIPVPEGEYTVYSPNGKRILTQLVDIPLSVIDIPTRTSTATLEIVFIAYLQPLSYKSFYVEKSLRTYRFKRDAPSSMMKYVQEYWKQTNETPFVDVKLVQDDVSMLNNDLSNVPVYVNTEKIDYEFDTEVATEVEETAAVFVDDSSFVENKWFTQAAETDGTTTTDINWEEFVPLPSPRYPNDAHVGNQYVTLRLNENSGQFSTASLPDGIDVSFNVRFYFYTAIDRYRTSGAYIFRPKENKPNAVLWKYARGPNGPVVKEIRSLSPDNIASTIRLYEGLNFIEHDWLVGPIAMDGGAGKEYVVRYKTDVKNNGDFFTDSNGRQMIRRKLFHRPQWNVTLQEPIPGNYYPVTNRISIQDGLMRATVLTDRAEGGTSLEKGQIELMLHRRLRFDEGLGVAEPLNEVVKSKGLVVRGRHRILFSRADSRQDNIEEKKQAIQFHLQPLVFVSDAKKMKLDTWKLLKNEYSWSVELPKGVHLLTLEPWQRNRLLLRLENYLELTEQVDIPNGIINIDLQKIFKIITIKSFRETTLAANRWADEEKSGMRWRIEKEFERNFNDAYGGVPPTRRRKDFEFVPDDGFNIILHAKQIRTFVVEYEFK